MDLGPKIYARLPNGLRSVAASARGYYLSYRRYGSETGRLVNEAVQRERWTQEQWDNWQHERLAYILERAATKVPYYREHWAARRRAGDRASWNVLANWPILEKETLRRHPKAFLAEDANPRKMYHTHTSGTSGTPIQLWQSLRTTRTWYALFEARWRNWYGVSRDQRWGILGGQLITPVEQRRPPFWVWNSGLRQLYLSTYHLAPDLAGDYLDAIVRHRVTYLWGYSSALYALAQEALRLGRKDVRVTVAITNAEPLYTYQKKAIAAAFQCPVQETYGMAEMVAAASECGHSRLHLWPEAGVVEVLDGDRPVAGGEAGELVCTGLVNQDMPLIRYRTRDRGARSVAGPCPCGRSLPVLHTIEGRMDDVLYTADGRRIGRLDPVFKADLPVQEVQIIQEALDTFRVRYVPAAGFTSATRSVINERLQQRLGPVNIEMEALDRIERGPNGKFRAVICNFTPAKDTSHVTVP